LLVLASEVPVTAAIAPTVTIALAAAATGTTAYLCLAGGPGGGRSVASS